MSVRQRITPFLWFDDQAEEAAAFYCAIFPNSRVDRVARYSKEAAQATGRDEGSAMTVEFVLDGQHVTALNGGPHFQFNEAVSLVVHCTSQEEVDHYWNGLGVDADPAAQQCGWIRDRYGVTWQVVPDELLALIVDPDPGRARRATAEMMRMKKIDIASLRRAADGID
jgi:predicted 3-demethylubiquinone-9 3-methyltransferase (glyoxalase superfamily)